MPRSQSEALRCGMRANGRAAWRRWQSGWCCTRLRGSGHGGTRVLGGLRGSVPSVRPGSGALSHAVFSSQGFKEPAEAAEAEEVEQGPHTPGRGAARGKKRKAATPAPAPALQPVKLSRAELYKPPTNEELNQLKETEDLFHSSLLRLQVSPTRVPQARAELGVGSSEAWARGFWTWTSSAGYSQAPGPLDLRAVLLLTGEVTSSGAAGCCGHHLLCSGKIGNLC